MARTEFLQKMAEVFEVDEVTEEFDLSEQWDSLVVLSAIAAIDEEYGVTVPVNELTECSRVDEIIALVERNREAGA